MENRGDGADPERNAASRKSAGFQHRPGGGSDRDAGEGGNADAPPVFAFGGNLYTDDAP